MTVRILNSGGMNSMNIVNSAGIFCDSIAMNNIFLVNSVGLNIDFL